MEIMLHLCFGGGVFDSLSVFSIIIIPGTGQNIFGAWNP
jgi:hypothetical protein